MSKARRERSYWHRVRNILEFIGMCIHKPQEPFVPRAQNLLIEKLGSERWEAQ
jgi:hypothetical protein